MNEGHPKNLFPLQCRKFMPEILLSHHHGCLWRLGLPERLEYIFPRDFLWLPNSFHLVWLCSVSVIQEAKYATFCSHSSVRMCVPWRTPKKQENNITEHKLTLTIQVHRQEHRITLAVVFLAIFALQTASQSKLTSSSVFYSWFLFSPFTWVNIRWCQGMLYFYVVLVTLNVWWSQQWQRLKKHEK